MPKRTSASAYIRAMYRHGYLDQRGAKAELARRLGVSRVLVTLICKEEAATKYVPIPTVHEEMIP